MFEARGITLTTLVVTIVVLLILAGVATYSGIEAIDNTKRTKFIAELKIMQSYVNQWYEDCKPSVNAENYDEKFASNVQTKFTINDKVAVNAASTEPINSEKVNTAKIALAAANVPSENYENFYLLEDNEKSALGIEGVSQAVLVSVRDRKVVSYLGLKYKGNMYYTIDSLDGENGIDAIYNVGYDNPNKNPPSILVTGRSVYNGETAKGAKYKFTVDVKYKFPGDVIQDSDYINKGDLYYGKIENGEVKNWNKTEDKTFIVDREGTYRIYYKDAAGNESEKTDYVIEPKATLIDGPNFNKKMKALSGTSSPGTSTNNNNIVEFKVSDTKPSSLILDNTNNLVSTNNSKYPIYMWFENGTIYLWSEENWIGFNSNSNEMFRQLLALKTANFMIFDTKNVTTMNYTFHSCNNLTDLNVSSFNTSNVTTMSGFFYTCNKLKDLDISNFDTSRVSIMTDMFRGCYSLTALDLSNFDTSRVTSFNSMFYGCSGLTTLIINRSENSQQASALTMFYGCSSLKSLDLSNFSTDKITTFQNMFNNCSNLITLKINRPENAVSATMAGMFSKCTNLTDLDLSNFNTSQVTSMASMFNGCSKLTNLNLSVFNTANVTSMYQMFYGCVKLKSLDLNNFDTTNVFNMGEMFNSCQNLENLDVSKFNTQSTVYMGAMFNGCKKLKEINVSNFCTKNVQEMQYMFAECNELTILNLESFNTQKVNNIDSMFRDSNNIITIYVSEDFILKNGIDSYNMFKGCLKIVGGNGTTYNASNVNADYARIDYIDTEHPENYKPGYFTRKPTI